MQDLIERRAALTALCEDCLQKYEGICPHPASRCVEFRTIKQLPAIEAEPVRHGRWIECDYKHMEHGMIETEPKAGLCCSECRTAFQKKKMTYKQYCAACGARMDATDMNVGGKGGMTNADRIRQMTDEELAKFLISSFCDYADCREDISCAECRMQWLQKEASEGEGSD